MWKIEWWISLHSKQENLICIKHYWTVLVGESVIDEGKHV